MEDEELRICLPDCLHNHGISFRSFDKERLRQFSSLARERFKDPALLLDPGCFMQGSGDDWRFVEFLNVSSSEPTIEEQNLVINIALELQDKLKIDCQI